MRRFDCNGFADAIAKKEAALKAQVRAALAETQAQTQQDFIKRSSGSLTSGVLRKMGHPYATRAPQTPLDPSIINVQSGEFRRNWKKAGPRQAGGGYSGSVTNKTMFGKYTAAQIMLGTRRMVARRIDTYVRDEMRPKFRSKMQAALRKGLRA